MSISWKQLIFFIFGVLILIVIGNLIGGDLGVLVFCITLFMFIIFVFYKEWSYYKKGLAFDNLLIKSENINNTIIELTSEGKYGKYIKEFENNQKYIIEKDDEFIVLSKKGNGNILLKLTKEYVEFNYFGNVLKIYIDNITNIDEIMGKYVSGVGINLKKKINLISGKEIVLRWENGSDLPIRRTMLLFKIKNFFEKYNIDIDVEY